MTARISYSILSEIFENDYKRTKGSFFELPELVRYKKFGNDQEIQVIGSSLTK
jgi:hypothetical protein